MSSYRWQVLQEILRSLKQDVSFVPEPGDKCSPILPDSIVFRKVSVKLTSQNQGFTFEPVFPGIIVSTPFSEPFDPTKGEVAHDEYVYHFLIQIIDSDNREPEADIQSYWKWQEQVRRLFQFNCMSNVDAPHVLSKSVNVDVVDETQWVRDENFVCGVHVAVQVWYTRGAT
jgi:hypothetical protein